MAFETTVTAELLGKRLGKTKEADVDDVEHAFETAVELLTDATATAFRTIPEHVCDDLVYRVGRSVYDGGKTQNGNSQLTTVQGETAVRAPRDPLATVGPTLARYVVGFS